jgi:multiple sugar transport system substrate-binding protein
MRAVSEQGHVRSARHRPAGNAHSDGRHGEGTERPGQGYRRHDDARIEERQLRRLDRHAAGLRPEAIAAATTYQTLLREAAPVGISGYKWYECQASSLQGRAAMWRDAFGFAAPIEDPSRFKVVGKVAYSVFPAGPKGRIAGLSADASGIPANGRKQGPAWLYLQWACSKTMMTRQLAGGIGAPPRKSAFAAVVADPPADLSRDWLDCVVESARAARPVLPQIVAVTEFRDICGVALTNMIGGAEPATELRKAIEQFKPILDKTEAA